MKGRKQSPFVGKTVPLVEDGVPILYRRYRDVSEILLGNDSKPPSSSSNGIAKVNHIDSVKDDDMDLDHNGTNGNVDNPTKKRKVSKEGEGKVDNEREVEKQHLSKSEYQEREKKKPKKDVADLGTKETKANGSRMECDNEAKNGEDDHIKAPGSNKQSGDANYKEAVHMRQVLGFTPTPSEGAKDAKTQSTSSIFSFSFSQANDHGNGDNGNNDDNDAKSKDGEDIPNGGEDRRVYVGGMPYGLSENEIKEFWEDCGSVQKVDCLTFPDTGRFRGIAYITFQEQGGFEKALTHDGDVVDGFTLKVKKWSEKGSKDREQDTQGSTRSPLSKDLKPLGEKVDGYNVAFVCNIPYDVTSEQLHEMFFDCGVERVRLHTDEKSGRSRGFAHLHFNTEDGLKSAIDKDGMSIDGRMVRVGYGKAPKDFGEKSGDGNKQQLKDEAKEKVVAEGEGKVMDVGRKSEGFNGAYVHNLPFKATKEKIMEFFKGCKIQNVALPEDPKERENLGYAIVEFEDDHSLDLAIGKNGASFGRRKLWVQYAKRKQLKKTTYLIEKLKARKTTPGGKKSAKKKKVEENGKKSEAQDDPLLALL